MGDDMESAFVVVPVRWATGGGELSPKAKPEVVAHNKWQPATSHSC